MPLLLGGAIWRSSTVATLEGKSLVYCAYPPISCQPRLGTRPSGLGESQGSLHEFPEILGFPKIWEPHSSFWEPNPNFWDSGINLVFFISEVDAELPFALRKISFKRVGVRSGVA
jgi:hypothetical protein